MRSLPALLLLALIGPALPFQEAAAQGYQDLDAERQSSERRQRSMRDIQAQLEDEVVREIVRGTYLKAGAGTGFFVGRYGAVPGVGGMMAAVMVTSISVGQDFVDNERNSMAWEITVEQGVYNGMPFEQQGLLLEQGAIGPHQLIQGDTRLFGLKGAYEYSLYPTRRFGIGIRVGGGIGFAPLLMDRDAYYRDAVGDHWRGQDSGVHARPLPMAFGGPTLEYYTKLSHFSIGADVDVAYILGMDLNITPVGYLKYTF